MIGDPCAQARWCPIGPYIDDSVRGVFQIFPLQVRCGIPFTDGSSGVDVVIDRMGTWAAFGFFATGLAVLIHGIVTTRRVR